MFFTFPEDAHWNVEQQAVEFGVEIGEYRGVVRVSRRVFQRLYSERPSRAVPRLRPALSDRFLEEDLELRPLLVRQLPRIQGRLRLVQRSVVIERSHAGPVEHCDRRHV